MATNAEYITPAPAQQPVMVQEFSAYMEQQRLYQEAMRADSKREQEAIAAAQKRRIARQEAEDQARRVPQCDGSSSKLVREWIMEIELTVPYTDQTTYIASQKAQGPLRRELEHFLAQRPDRRAVPWKDLKDHIEATFLSPHEDEHLRHEVSKIEQGAYESSGVFGRRFRELADLAYPGERQQDGSLHRNVDRTRILLDAYIRALRDRRLVERVLREGRPQNFESAMAFVALFEADEYRIQTALSDNTPTRQEEPMEIGALTPRPRDPQPDQTSEKDADIAELRRQMAGMTKELTKLIATVKLSASGEQASRSRRSSRPSSSSDGPRPEHRFAENGDPICNYCKRQGHIARHCRSRRAQRQQNSRPSNNAQGGQ